MPEDKPKQRDEEAPFEQEKKPGGSDHEETKENNKKEGPTEEQPTATDSHGSQDIKNIKNMTFADLWYKPKPEPAVDKEEFNDREAETLTDLGLDDFDKNQQEQFKIWFQYKKVRESENKPFIKWVVFYTEFAKMNILKNKKIEHFELSLKKEATANEVFVNFPNQI